jgi:septal ring factor EnvC (AmiA/AmiB activator)
MMEPSELYSSAYQIGGFVAVCAMGFFAMWLRASKTATTVAKDSAERDIIATLVLERDRAQADAREAWRQRTDDAQRIAKLTAENESLQRDIGRLTDEVARLRRSVDSLRALIQQQVPGMPTEALDSGHVPLES